MAGTVHRTVPAPRQYVGLPGKIGNANTRPPTNVGGFLPESFRRIVSDGKIPLACPVGQITRTFITQLGLLMLFLLVTVG